MTPSHLCHVRAPPNVKIFLIIKTELQKRNLNNENWLKAFNEPVCRKPPTAVNTRAKAFWLRLVWYHDCVALRKNKCQRKKILFIKNESPEKIFTSFKSCNSVA